jgi:hypothetical protein
MILALAEPKLVKARQSLPGAFGDTVQSLIVEEVGH